MNNRGFAAGYLVYRVRQGELCAMRLAKGWKTWGRIRDAAWALGWKGGRYATTPPPNGVGGWKVYTATIEDLEEAICESLKRDVSQLTVSQIAPGALRLMSKEISKTLAALQTTTTSQTSPSPAE